MGGVAPYGVLALFGNNVDFTVKLNFLLLFAVPRIAGIALQTASTSAKEASEAADLIVVLGAGHKRNIVWYIVLKFILKIDKLS